MKEDDFDGEVYCKNCKCNKKQSILRINTFYDKEDRQIIFECKTCDFVNVHFKSIEFCRIFDVE